MPSRPSHALPGPSILGSPLIIGPCESGIGHSVQWVAPSPEHKLEDLTDTRDTARFMHVLHDCEFEAAAFGMQLMRERGVTRLDQWYSDFVPTDWQYVRRSYETDELPAWDDCVVVGAPLNQPAPLPVLTLGQVE